MADPGLAQAAFNAFGAMTSAYIGNAQAQAQARVANATMRFNKAMTERRNTLATYNARMAENLVTLQEINAKAEHVQMQEQIQNQTLAAKGEASATMNSLGISGKTRERLDRVIDTQAGLATRDLNMSLDKAFLDSIFQRNDIERQRVQGKDHSLFIKQKATTVNPFLAGMMAGGQAYIQSESAIRNTGGVQVGGQTQITGTSGTFSSTGGLQFR
jgi:hypothetical protein